MNRQMIETPGEAFYSPFSTMLIKGDEADGKWNVYLEASNEGLDLESEQLLCKALKDAADYYLTHGVLSWDHKHKSKNDPQFIIGEPVDVRFTGDNRTLVQGFLYKSNKIAQGLWDNVMSGAKRLGASVGGGVLKKSGGRVIEKVIWDETAITHQPVNDGTLGKVQIIPFAEFAKSLNKALMAGGGVDAGSFTGGRALIPESLQGADTGDVVSMPYEEARAVFDDILAQIRQGLIMSENGVVQYILNRGYSPDVTATLLKFISGKIPELLTNYGGSV